FFASSLAIIHLNKLTTLSLRDIPPLNPFERRDQTARYIRGGNSISVPADVALASKASALVGLICFVRFATYASTNSPP
ncbi:MAG: hypothetical protein CL920_26255, partial [Deltaproteobacteria bacterium]|nr:hypothetical protein [Deltaproteobacteria bacterium]